MITHRVSKETQLFLMDFSWGPGSGTLVYTLLQKKGNFNNVLRLSVQKKRIVRALPAIPPFWYDNDEDAFFAVHDSRVQIVDPI